MTADNLYRWLVMEIETGKLPVNEPVPTEIELSKKHHAARGTVRAVLQRLAEEGFVRTGQGRRRVVQQTTPIRLARLQIPSTHFPKPGEEALTDPVWKPRATPSFGGYLKQQGLEPFDQVVRPPTRVPCYRLTDDGLGGTRFDVEGLGKVLGIPLQTEVLWFLRLRWAQKRPLVLQWAVIPASLLGPCPTDPTEFLRPGGLTDLYATNGIVRWRVQTTYAPTRGTKAEASQLLVATGAPLIEERRVSYCLDSATKREIPYENLLTLYPERVALTFEWLDPAQGPGGPAPMGTAN